MNFNLETMKVNVTTVVSVVVASFALYFFIEKKLDENLLTAKLYTIDELIKDDLEVVAMYRFQITNGIAQPNAASRMEEIEAKIARRMREADVLRDN